MAVTTGPRTGVTLWSSEDDPVDRTQFEATHTSIEALMAVDVQQVLPLPAPGVRGRYLWVTDDRGGRLYRDSGVSLFDLGPKPIDGPATGYTARVAGHASAGVGDDVLQLRGKTGQTGNLLRVTDPTGATTYQRVTAAGELVSEGASTAILHGARTTGDTVDRFAARGDGQIQWSDGTLAADLLATRTSAGRLNITGTLQVQNADTGGAPLSFATLVVQQAVGQTGKLLVARNSSSQTMLQVDELGTVLAGNGSNAAPSYAFGNTPGLGMYRYSTSVLGFRVPAGGWWSFRNSVDAQVAKIGDDGALFAVGGDHYFGAYALGAGTGVSRLHLQTGASTAYVMAEGDGADRDLTLRVKGAGQLRLQDETGWSYFRVGSTVGIAAIGADHRFGPNALGAAGNQLHITTTGTQTLVAAEGSGANVILALQGQGTGGIKVIDGAGTTSLATIDNTGVLAAIGANHYLGSFALGTGSLTRLRVNTPSATQVVLYAEGSGANVGMELRSKGSGNIGFADSTGTYFGRIYVTPAVPAAGNTALELMYSTNGTSGLQGRVMVGTALGAAANGVPTGGKILYIP